MLSPGLDRGLKGMCVGEKKKIIMSPALGLIDLPTVKADGRKVIYEVELISISPTTTVATFHYLDLNGDKKISSEEAESLVTMFMRALTTDIGIDVKTLVSFFMTLHDKDGDGFISDAEFLDSVTMNEKVLSSFGLKEEL
jgi:FK506-binding protein 14